MSTQLDLFTDDAVQTVGAPQPWQLKQAGTGPSAGDEETGEAA